MLEVEVEVEVEAVAEAPMAQQHMKEVAVVVVEV